MKTKNLNELSGAERIALMKSTYAKPSYFQNLFGKDSIEIDCMALAHLFRQEISRMLIEKSIITKAIPLEKLHEYLSDELRAYNFDDGVSKVSTYFYETDNEFMKVYYQFIALLRSNFVKEPFLFQKTPTIRIHCPNSKNSNHYPRYHTDLCYGHPPQEMNIWIPFTELMDGHKFRLMSCMGSKQMLEKFDYDLAAFIQNSIHDKSLSHECDKLSYPVTTEFGKFLAFDSRSIHTCEPLTAHTRISMDMRILPLSLYNEMNIAYQGSGRRKIIFESGQCYHEKNSDHFLHLNEVR